MRRTEFLLAVVAATPAFADLGSDLSACTRIDDGNARLACYDKLAQRPAPLAPAAPLPPAPAVAPTSPAPVATPVPPPAPAPVAAAPVPPPAPAEPSGTIRSQLKGEFTGWEPKMLLHLANGQVWRCTGCSTQVIARPLFEPAVTIEESFTGAWFVRVEGTSLIAKVKRVR